MFLNMRVKKRHQVTGEDQRRALGSPLRLELIGLFTDRRPLSVAEIAARMGRSATSIHYHVRLLEECGLLVRVGERPAGKRSETLFRPVAEMLVLDRSDASDETGREHLLATMRAAFRMAERDMRAALENPETRTRGAQRNLFAARVHFRMSKAELAELNRHLRGIERFLGKIQKDTRPSTDDVFMSLTLALMPLPDREVES
jgi:AcrR family transcriptional regulator